MGTAIADYRFEDFDQMAETWRARGWGAEYGQLGPGRFQGRLLCSAVGSSKILRGRWGGRIRHQGLQPKGTISLGSTLFSQGQGRFMGVPIGRDDVIVQASRTPFELAGAPVWDAAVLELPESAVAHEVAALTQRDPWPIVEHQGLAHLDPHTGARVRAACRSYVAAVERHQPGREEARLAGMARDLASLVIGAIADTRIDPVPTPRASRAREILRKVEDFAADCPAGSLSVADICREIAVSERSLRHAFQQLLDISPAAYLKAQRLNRVRKKLLASDPDATLVKQVAYAHGFWHLGQFSVDYRAFFGERPSQTLASDPARVSRIGGPASQRAAWG